MLFNCWVLAMKCLKVLDRSSTEEEDPVEGRFITGKDPNIEIYI